mmetsp:Transcript_12309/g.21018  ORF Transcript_12309/g.21018 Transcript_12309/m.21018 type:complete len:252 (-) Transcript_12309:103-858(-)|eukprot:CAMPEP_0184692276 /NCGR_PEP_ID=MMETSP0313-20130426/831_1 /TAXON_ID=2792 /ORGANISM="Porphyridium aerugineum, Strain SAG 1380-2" /LENGTH=251 /DNA_ID=CAMNT_0027150101 /DNA_START=54 /DNA_END=809 /DNA_ORIENTATION=+
MKLSADLGKGGKASSSIDANYELPIKRTQDPYVTGSSVLGIKCIDGVVISADTLASYGSMAKFRKISRLFKVSDNCVIGVGGEYSDFQQLQTTLNNVMTEQYCFNDGHTLTPSAIHQYLGRVMYQRRNKMDPLWNSVVIGGYSNGEITLGQVDLYGTNFQSEVIATGYGLHMGLPLLRNAYRPEITVEEAKKVMEDIMRVLYYRDARSTNSIQIATATKDGVTISEMFDLETKWDFERFVKGSRDADPSTW